MRCDAINKKRKEGQVEIIQLKTGFSSNVASTDTEHKSVVLGLLLANSLALATRRAAWHGGCVRAQSVAQDKQTSR